MGGRGRGQAPRLKAEQFGLSKEDLLNNKALPEDFPSRQPTIPPEKITVTVKNMLDVGLSMKEDIKCRMESGKFTPCLAYPLELDKKKKKSRKKTKRGSAVDISKHLEELAKRESIAAENSDLEAEGESNAGSSDEEEARDSDDSRGSESADEEMDEGNDYNQMHDVDDDEDMGPPSDDEEREAMA
ncbi:glutamic acid-rich protein-like [Neocloeon triangulifer]|uniref:glutamic acid-rich protein-like n=1 Tax=Neocloeon triangulifer TaxID=2078957 RepID=UPI00286F89B2|nr:glutamic acid-rich protein-like [Neocloeon triangulifer]